MGLVNESLLAERRFQFRFNPRPRVGGDDRGLSHEQAVMFQSTPPRGGRPATTSMKPATMCFNPRPRVGGDQSRPDDLKPVLVSIHAPAWGATQLRCRCAHAEGVSIHAPAWGATHLGNSHPRKVCFNPRPRVGGDTRPSERPVRPTVSIHAPAWGATFGSEGGHVP